MSKQTIEDLKEIRSIMDRSTRFISLSGLSGVLAGVYAIIAAVIAHFKIEEHLIAVKTTNTTANYANMWDDLLTYELLFIAVIVLIAAVITAFFLTKRKARKHAQSIWNAQSYRLITSFMIPLSIGGLFTLVLLQNQFIGLVAPAMLIFYGIACISAAKFTLGTVKYLGISCAILGLINTQFIGYGLYFWAAGFGLCHIIYGSIMYFKYDKSPSKSLEN